MINDLSSSRLCQGYLENKEADIVGANKTLLLIWSGHFHRPILIQ